MIAPAPIAVTGFGPFPGVPANPTSLLIDDLAAHASEGFATFQLETRWDIGADMQDIAGRHAVVLMFGVSGKARRLRYERLARPAANRMHDAYGHFAMDGAAHSRRTALPVDRLVHEARVAGFPVEPSSDAGAYICNAAYGAALSANPSTLFIHVPPATQRGAFSRGGLYAHALWLIDVLQDASGLRGW